MHEQLDNLSIAVRGSDEPAARAAFEQIFRTTIDALVDFAVTIGLSRAAAQDVVSDVFLAIWRNRKEWHPANVRAYLFGAVRRRAINERTHIGRNVDISELLDDENHAELFIDDSASASDIIEREDVLSRLDTILGELPAMRRAVVVLRLREQLSYAEIATVFGISQNAAQAHVSRAMKAIRDAMPGLL